MGGKLSYPHQDIPEDRTFLITGGNTGIGYQTAKSIAKLGGRVVIACRNEEKAKEAVEKMQREHQEEVKKKRADDKAAAAKDKAAAAKEKEKADKAAAAEKEKADKAAAAKAAAEKKKSSASNKTEEKKEEPAKEGDAAKEDAAKGDDAKIDAPKEDGAKEEAPKEEQAKEEAPKEDAPKQEDAPKEDAPTENAVKEDAPKEEEKTTSEGAVAAEAEAAKPDGEAATEEEKKEEEEEEEPIAPLKVEFMVLDLESFESTMKFVEAYKAKGYPLHVLVCNAGYGAGPKETTSDGYEKHFQVNYLSHFLMTLHLLPLLRQSAPNSRIVNVSSTVHTSGVFNLENINGEQSFDRIKFYGNSKLYQIMSMFALERRLKDTGISVFSVHPGYVDSEFNRGTADNKLYSFMDSLAGTFRMKRNVQDGAMTSLVASLDDNLNDKTGIYFKSCKPAASSAASKKVESQEALWKFSVDLLKEKDLVNDDLLKDLTLPEPEPTGESKPEGETKAEGEAAGASGDAKAEEEKKTEETKEEKKEEETKEEGGGDAAIGDKKVGEEEKKEEAEEKKEE